jgi:SAM-dependent methyltransferase
LSVPEGGGLRSFRDPDGFVFQSGHRILRCVFPHAAANIRLFLSSPCAVQWMQEGILSLSVILDPSSGGFPMDARDRIPQGAIVLEHALIPFSNYPYEWTPEMLYCAAQQTLTMAQTALESGFELKDASPYNVMFAGTSPVFLDVLSFASRDPLDSLWRAYGQFVRNFLYPLIANRRLGLRLDELLLVHRDGLEPERILRMFDPWRRFVPPLLGTAAIPALLSRESKGARETKGANAKRFRPRRAKDPAEAKFLLDRVLRRARRALRAVAPKPEKRVSSYEESGHNYTPAAWEKKERIVGTQAAHLRVVLDVGCHTGRFSFLAARQGARVVALDRDPRAAGMVFQRAREEALDILPLVIDIARPPGATGWANQESSSFLDRARGKFDGVLALALVHHLLANEGVPLDAIFDLLAELTTGLAIVEYIDPGDIQFQRLMRGRESLFLYITREVFENAARRRFQIVESHDLIPTRAIYILQRAN